jgi:hypothetical protein
MVGARRGSGEGDKVSQPRRGKFPEWNRELAHTKARALLMYVPHPPIYMAHPEWARFEAAVRRVLGKRGRRS